MTQWPADLPPFIWGVATSSHQVEGSNHNDWTAWEHDGRVVEASGQACDHYHRYPEDFKLLQGLNVNAYRFSVEWSRVEPEEGRFNPEVLKHYKDVAESARSHGMEPFVTLHHFTLPLWFARQGGFLQPQAAKKFAAYVEKVIEAFENTVRFYLTINEPMVYSVMGYGLGTWPPGHHKLRETLRIAPALLKCHQQAYHLIKRLRPNSMVGLAHHLVAFAPYDAHSWLDRLNSGLFRYLFNQRFLHWAKTTQDFIGLNYYTRQYAQHRHMLTPVPSRPGAATTEMGWEIYPEGLEQILVELKAFDKPILVTENGIAAQDDRTRSEFITAHLQAVSRAQNQGAMVRGYFYWSALDNFEWAEGYRPRFGLIDVNYRTQKRTVRPSAGVYRNIILANRGRWPITVPQEPAEPACRP